MKSRKWKKISALLFLGIALLFLLMPTYMQEALIHWFPDISDTYIFPSDTVGKADSCWEWPVARDANRYRMTDDEEAYLEKYGTPGRLDTAKAFQYIFRYQKYCRPAGRHSL